MRTAASWTEARTLRKARDANWRAVVDVGHLLRFRATTTRRPGAFLWMMLLFVGLTVLAMTLPNQFEDAGTGTGYALDALLLLPTAMVAFLLISIVSAVASGGGRELLAREYAVSYPISPTTDHLGAMLLAPLNIAWLLQAWFVLGATAYALEADRLPAAQIGMLLWLAAATAIGQVVAWTMEAIRRTHHGVFVVRGIGVVLGAVVVWLQLTGRLSEILDSLSTQWLVLGLIGGFDARWFLTIGVELTILVAAVAIGAVPAHVAARRTPRDEVRVETGTHPGRAMPGSPLAALVRIDRGSVWRTVPMRRGLAVLAIGPGLVALAGGLGWSQMTILPGLVASGGALLFGVNAWCLDARGGLWRESLPVGAGVVFAARSWVLAEFLLAASFVTLILAGLRAGIPTGAELTALLCTWVVVILQVVSAAMRWSSRRPFSVDMRSARATPAPPAVMVGYSAKLATTTTVTSLIFSGLARVPHWELSVIVALPFLVWSLVRLLHARDLWVDPAIRARVVTTVAA